jgi:YHS domain-containing protein
MKAKGLMLLAAMLVITVAFVGCRKKEPAAPAETKEVASAAVEQTTCPIMEGNKINKDVFVEYKGKKVYFCCPGCKGKFEADPEKYTANLPQFQK